MSPAPPTDAKYLNTSYSKPKLISQNQPHAVLCRHCFPSSALPGHNDGLVGVIPLHELESLFRHGVYVGVQVSHVLAPVGHDGVIVVYLQLKVGIDCHQNDATVGVDLIPVHKPDLQVVENCWLVEVREGGEVVLPYQDVWVPQGGKVLIFLDINGDSTTIFIFHWESLPIKILGNSSWFPHSVRILDPDPGSLQCKKMKAKQ